MSDDSAVKTFINKEGFSCNLYVISVNGKTILIDPGFYNKTIKEYLISLNGLDAVFLTHSHWDHFQALDEIYNDFPGVLIYVHEFDKKFLNDPKLNCSYYFGREFSLKQNLIYKINNLVGDRSLIEQYGLEIIRVPGHTIGSCLFLFKNKKAMFVGDTILPDGIPAFNFPTGNLEQLKRSWSKFLDLGLQDDCLVFSGHGMPQNYKQIKDIVRNYFLYT